MQRVTKIISAKQMSFESCIGTVLSILNIIWSRFKAEYFIVESDTKHNVYNLKYTLLWNIDQEYQSDLHKHMAVLCIKFVIDLHKVWVLDTIFSHISMQKNIENTFEMRNDKG